MALDEDKIRAEFDCCTEDGTVVFNRNYQTTTLVDNGFRFEFRILSGLTHKPVVPGEQTRSPTWASTPRPGSDIDVRGFEVADIGSTHLLAFNKFAAARPHLLLVTQDGFRRQHEQLDVDDFAALCRVMSSLKQERYLAIFNCGVDGGCSRLHKHMQVFPAPAVGDLELWPDRHDPSAWSSLPFKCFVHRFENGLPSADSLAKIYTVLLRQAEEAAGYQLEGDGGKAVPHNVVLDRKWILVVPRRTAALNGVVANAAAMLGMVWVPNEEALERWTRPGPANILAHVGIPARAAHS
ncbi:hypothetical protein C7999DRAFT_41393 [Corynascus novoguineensis]|uniref:Uncharacterized protein n=1 Tax=Corynascus novoguineensis TaxID=1126955 RepID=A0AAN7CSK9_9PEZI|nr:hypothetical protein C7999DRAFT_41393 [Corynascus novoguineensis]